MRISLWRSALVAFLLLLSAAAQNSSSPIKVVESKMRLDFDPRVQLVLPITNSSLKPVRGNVVLEFLDNEDQVAASGNLEIVLEPGNYLNNLFLGDKGLPTRSPSSLATYRLRYRVKPSEPSAFVPLEGIVQLGRIMTDPYQVRTAAAPKTRPGTQYFVRARVENPHSGRAYAGVEVVGKLQLEPASGDDRSAPPSMLRKAKADADGNVLFTFDLPAGHKYEGGGVVVSVTRGALLEEEKFEFKYWDAPRFSLMTDKPIYQPGQTVHMRVQAFAPDHSALADGVVELEITDPDNLNAFRQELKTSRFGIGSADWQVPANLRLGKFQISASLKSGDWYDSAQADQEIKISRYDLPNFTVEATPDLPYYLQNQSAKVRVTARYLFGETVAQGHVRIARVNSREWIYHEQSYRIDEEDITSGELSSGGEYTAEIPLKADFEDFADSDVKYRDIPLAAYVTDASTRRTEQRRFDLRITHQAIHLYAMPLFPGFIGAPAQFYVVANYADGTPAAVDVSIFALKPNAEGRLNEDAEHPLEAVALRTITTNSYGVAKVTGVAIPEECLIRKPLAETARLRLIAHGNQGASGMDSSFIAFSPVSDYLRLRTSKTMYREGEDIGIEVDSNLKDDAIVVEVIGKSEPLKSKVVRLVGGNGSVKFPYDPRFNGTLRIMAYSLSVSSKASAGAYARILYPAKQELNLGIDLRKISYKPGEQAIADLSLTTALGRPIQGAFGAVVFDKAVSERARTDQDFGGRDFGFPDYSWYSDESWTISGISIRDLLAWDSVKPFPDGLDLLAEIMVNRRDEFAYGQRENETEIAGGEAYFSAPSALYEKIVRKSTEPVNAALDSSYKKTGKYPFSPGELRSTLKENGIDFDALRDPWGMPFETVFSSERNQDVVELKSTGPDKQSNTQDDFSTLKVLRPNVLVTALNASYRATDDYPRNLEQLKATLQKEGIDFDALRDPWGTPYQAVFSLAGPTLGGQHDSLEIRSAGPDRQRDTADDFTVATLIWPFFGRVGHAIDRVNQNYFVRASKYIRDYDTLQKEMLSNEKIDLDAARDPWGNRYRYDFLVERNAFVIRVVSSGRDGVFSTEEKPSPDDLILWYSRIQYFQRESTAIDNALAAYFKKNGIFPASMDELQPVLALAKLSPAELKDPWGRQYVFTFAKQAFYANRVQIKTYSVYPDRPRRTTTVVPVTQYIGFIYVMSNGPSEQYKAPFSVAEFSGVMTEQASKDPEPMAAADRTALSNGTGGMKGQVTDSAGAVVPGVSVRATGEDGKRSYEAVTGEDGIYVLRNMAAGLYQIHFIRAGFVESVVAQVPVRAGSVTDLDAALNIDVTQKLFALNSVTVEPSLKATASCETCSTVVETSPSTGTATEKGAPGFTPRVRQYFPETLIWNPEIVTDPQGHARLQFKLADNITTWTLSAAASTLDGQTGFLRKEIPAFQPFFVEHDPPKTLTQGDVVALPVVLRSYLKAPQTVNVEMKPERWFSFLNAPVQKITVPAGGSADAIFNLRVEGSANEAKQQVIASNAQTGDAIERIIAVHPNGEEVSTTFFDVLGGDRSVAEFDISEHAIRGSTQAVLKLYPNLMAHVVEGARGISIRPGACAEQIASITTANLRTLQILNKFQKDTPKVPGQTNAGLIRQTQGYLRDGYVKLLAYREVDGGFSYWGRGGSDLAVTGNVLQALAGARNYIDVDAKIIGDARDFIIKQQQADGSWLSARWPDYKPHPDALLTAYLAKVLANANASALGEEKKRTDAGVEKALLYLENKLDEWKESYGVANYVLAAIATNRKEFQEKARRQLLSIAHDEGSTTYWNVEENSTPFYGWGYAGRLETTALAVQALSLLAASNDVDGQSAKQAHRGLLFLLQGKDRDGAWSSTAATVNVIDAFIATMPSGRIPGSPSKATLWLNGKSSGAVRIPAPSEIAGPVVVALPPSILNGKNKVELRRPRDNSPLMTQIVSLHYEPWEYSPATKGSNLKPGETRALKLSIRHDRTKASVGEPIRCTIKAERIGFQGYGMMLAEIGLPPGVDVDRASLDAAMEQNYELKHYDILPDRLVFYLWPKAGGTEFNFVFRPRFRMEALNAPSLLYDYYNPEARSAVEPVKFVIN